MPPASSHAQSIYPLPRLCKASLLPSIASAADSEHSSRIMLPFKVLRSKDVLVELKHHNDTPPMQVLKPNLPGTHTILRRSADYARASVGSEPISPCSL